MYNNECPRRPPTGTAFTFYILFRYSVCFEDLVQHAHARTCVRRRYQLDKRGLGEEVPWMDMYLYLIPVPAEECSSPRTVANENALDGPGLFTARGTSRLNCSPHGAPRRELGHSASSRRVQ